MKSNTWLPNIQSLGRTRYILYFGVLGWGLVTAALFTGWNLYTKKHVDLAELVVPFVVFPISGVLWGAATWGLMKKQSANSLGKGSK